MHACSLEFELYECELFSVKVVVKLENVISRLVVMKSMVL